MKPQWISSSSGVRLGTYVLLTIPFIASCSDQGPSEHSAKASSPVTAATFALTAPKGVSPLAPVLESANSLVIGAGAKVMPTAPVVAMGIAGTTRVEPDAQLNDLWSRGSTDLRDRVTILGWVHTKNLTLGNNVALDPAKKDLAPAFVPVSSLVWNVTFPTTAVTLDSNPPLKFSLNPGYYTTVRLGESGAELTLRTGTYYVDTLTLEASTKILLDQTAGPVIVYAANVTGLRSTFAAIDGATPDLFLGYLGTNQITVEREFHGALVAPKANVVIRSVGVPHSGFFAGKNVELDAHAIVNYGVPNSVIVAANPDETTCRSLVPLRSDLVGIEQQQQYALDLARYCGICLSTLDSDNDEVRDCIDECPYDPKKTKPGITGCGNSDEQSDPDRVPDHFDQCDEDPRNVYSGECGCVGQRDLKPAGTRCYRPVCPGQTNPACDGQGICGTVDCTPKPDCVPVVSEGHTYFFCGGVVPPGTGPLTPTTNQGAHDACAAKGLIMARVDTYDQNLRIQNLLKSYSLSQAWLGGSQRSAAGVWRWANLGSFDGDQFWSGGATGSSVNGKFAFWSLGQPGTAQCLAIQSADGRWTARDCATILPYICEHPPSEATGSGTGGNGGGDLPLADQPAPLSTNCVAESGGAAPLPGPGQMSQLMDQYDQAGTGVFVGAASDPPAEGSACPDSGLAQNCPLANVQTLMCADGVTVCDCAAENAVRLPSQPDICMERFGAGYVCRVTKDDPTCTTCPWVARCGTLDCSETAPQFPTRCDQLDVCPSGADEFTFEEPDPGSDLTAQNVTPDQFFPVAPSTTPTQEYYDEPDPTRTGKDHVWCQLGMQDPNKVQPASTDMNKQGKSGGTSPISVSFEPDLIFDAKPNPLAFGQSDLKLTAKASMSAKVDLAASMLAPSGVSVDVFYAGIGIKADRCRVSTKDDTALRVFGNNVDISAYVPVFDTDEMDETKDFAKTCKETVANYIVKADRLKKAFRDAQQLLFQYETLKSQGKVYDANLCKDLGIEQLASKNFPLAGICPENEPPELTINRFIDYYQRDGLGEISALKEITGALSNATGSLRNAILTALDIDDGYDLKIPFVDFKRSETKTIVHTPFTIGPVPMTLEIAAVTGYGVNGAFNLNLQFPTSLDGNIGDLSNPDAPSPEQIAAASATVEPWASAGLSIFVGANFVIGNLGIEGAITLAKISAPTVAGVGLAIASQADTRPIPTDIQSVSSLAGSMPRHVFGVPKAYQFYLSYKYGASIRLQDVLSGEVNGRLRINFWLFSRTWRKRIVKFNGWSKEFPLIGQNGTTTYIPIGGTGTRTASGNGTGMGRSELPLPFTFLKRLVPPTYGSGRPDSYDDLWGDSGAAGAPGTGGASGTTPAPTAVDKTKVEQFSYDTLCCSKQGEACLAAGRPACCEPLECNGATETTYGTCQPKAAPACANANEPCGFNQETGETVTCCSGEMCPKSGVCQGAPACIPYGDTCWPGYYDNCCSAPCTVDYSDGSYHCVLQIG